ncbi:chaperone protein dnaJ C76, chloroplastic-like [Ziziphus jujuba]|uniref:Chaperone protein dnaJ C76, chloroplastic-like n=1 Tax=Ziziphus jujuba TaxID=326968 RepID=A0A6P3ZUZ3_ZIZJJ|nr:chaperone protein dnaJ C76, chloroplastic-like [Ziziphus jujuba]
MLVSVASICQFRVPKASHVYEHSTVKKPIWRWRQRSPVIRCCNRKEAVETKMEKNYYELLGVSVDSEPLEIKEAYRKLQKKYHPDIAGQEGHEHTLLLNEAYKVLMREDLRRKYDASIGQMRAFFSGDMSGLGYSSWDGSLRSKALFVDGNACIGCRECVHHASNTFVMDEALGCARVKVQYGDDEQKLEVSVDSCPVNCIYWVDREELPVLEFLVQPQPKEGYGVFGGGWERPKNVFAAAESFSKQLKNQTANQHQRNTHFTVEEETPAQAEARVNASKKINAGRFSRLWDWAKRAFQKDM